MTFEIKMNCDNAAFEDSPADEIGTILGTISNQLLDQDRMGFYQTIFDSNGNDVGRWRLK